MKRGIERIVQVVNEMGILVAYVCDTEIYNNISPLV